MPLVDNNVASLSNWIVMGPFENKIQNNKAIGLDMPFAPETGIGFGQVFKGLRGLLHGPCPRLIF